MKIILENVVKGISVTGVAKIVDGENVLNNVPFNVPSKASLDIFVDNLLKIQTEFTGITDGEYTASPVPVKTIDPVQEALSKVHEGQRNLDLKIISQSEYDALVVAYKTLASTK